MDRKVQLGIVMGLTFLLSNFSVARSDRVPECAADASPASQCATAAEATNALAKSCDLESREALEAPKSDMKECVKEAKAMDKDVSTCKVAFKEVRKAVRADYRECKAELGPVLREMRQEVRQCVRDAARQNEQDS